MALGLLVVALVQTPTVQGCLEHQCTNLLSKLFGHSWKFPWAKEQKYHQNAATVVFGSPVLRWLFLSFTMCPGAKRHRIWVWGGLFSILALVGGFGMFYLNQHRLHFFGWQTRLVDPLARLSETVGVLFCMADNWLVLSTKVSNGIEYSVLVLFILFSVDVIAVPLVADLFL